MEMTRIAGLRDRDLLAEGLVVGEGRLLAARLLEACRRRPSATSRAGLPLPAFEAIGLACVPSLAEEFGAFAEGLCPVGVMPEAELAAQAGYPFHRGVLAVARRVPQAGLAGLGEARRVIILPETIDPENMGSIMRSAAALGWDGILAGEGCCDHLSRRAVRVSMGAAFSLPVLPLEGPGVVDRLSGEGWRLLAAVVDRDARDLREIVRRGEVGDSRLALLIGNEFSGLGPEWLPGNVERITLPMEAGSDSLNAAAAAAVFLWSLALFQLAAEAPRA